MRKAWIGLPIAAVGLLGVLLMPKGLELRVWWSTVTCRADPCTLELPKGDWRVERPINVSNSRTLHVMGAPDYESVIRVPAGMPPFTGNVEVQRVTVKRQ